MRWVQCVRIDFSVSLRHNIRGNWIKLWRRILAINLLRVWNSKSLKAKRLWGRFRIWISLEERCLLHSKLVLMTAQLSLNFWCKNRLNRSLSQSRSETKEKLREWSAWNANQSGLATPYKIKSISDASKWQTMADGTWSLRTIWTKSRSWTLNYNTNDKK